MRNIMKKATVFFAGLFFLALTGFAAAEYIDNGDGTITDTNTNLMWHKTYARSVNWDTANSYCTQSGTGGYYDWRLPTLTELQVLVDPAEYPCIDPIFSCYSYIYWTSTVEGDSAWGIQFTYGGAILKEKIEAWAGRCVRGATSPGNCISVGSDLYINAPCVEYNGVRYILGFKYYTNPALPAGNYWKLDSIQEK